MEHLGLCLFTCQMRYYKMIYWGLLHFASGEKNVSVSREERGLGPNACGTAGGKRER